MKSSLVLWGVIGGLVAGLLTSYFRLSLPFFFVGTVFAVCMVPVIGIWVRQSRRDASGVWLGIVGFILLATAAPWLCILSYIGVERLWDRLKLGVILLPGRVSPAFLVGTIAGIVVWVAVLELSLKLMTGWWDAAFAIQLALAGAVVLGAAWGVSLLRPDWYNAFGVTFAFCGLLLSGLLLGAGFGRRAVPDSDSIARAVEPRFVTPCSRHHCCGGYAAEFARILALYPALRRA